MQTLGVSHRLVHRAGDEYHFVEDEPAAMSQHLQPAIQLYSDTWWTIAFAPSTWSNWILAIVAGIAAFLAVRTLRAINRQADIADRALSFGREPFVVATKFELGEMTIGIIKTPNVSYGLKNYGFGPAFVEHLMVICEPRKALKQPPSYMGASIQASTLGQVIGPNEVIDVVTTSKVTLEDPPDGTLSESEYRMLFEGHVGENFFLYGYVIYDDIFRKGHVTGFAALWDSERRCMRLASEGEAEGYNYHYQIKKWKPPSLWQRISGPFKRKVRAARGS